MRCAQASPIVSARTTLSYDALISKAELAKYRTKYVEELLKAEHGDLTELDRQVAESLATHATLAENIEAEFEVERTFGERLSDHLASFGGIWTFIIIFGSIIFVWISKSGSFRSVEPAPQI